MLEPRSPDYPAQKVTVHDFPNSFDSYFPTPRGLNYDWPPPQLQYLYDYLKTISCKTIVLESHYIDRDHVDDTALFYARSLRPYRNYCQRIHFFNVTFDENQFQRLIDQANSGGVDSSRSFLQEAYLGFMVVRPLPGCPVGRTVLRTYPSNAEQGHTRVFDGIRRYKVHLAAFELEVRGLAFQQQDQGVSACATTALWSSLQCMAHRERLAIPTPAEITEAASRYLLVEGRSLPSNGLTVHQISEATRTAGLASVVIPSRVGFSEDRKDLHGYITSGFAPVLGVTLNTGDHHAVCAVGVKLGNVEPQTDPSLHHRDASTAVKGIYVHDDQLGPYVSERLNQLTDARTGKVMTVLDREVTGASVYSVLHSIIVPLPKKIRLTLRPVRHLGVAIAETLVQSIPSLDGKITLHCRYRLATAYRQEAYGMGLSAAGVTALVTELVLSRYVAVIEFGVESEGLLDILIDSTETQANPSVLAFVQRPAFPRDEASKLDYIATRVGARVIA